MKKVLFGLLWLLLLAAPARAQGTERIIRIILNPVGVFERIVVIFNDSRDRQFYCAAEWVAGARAMGIGAGEGENSFVTRRCDTSYAFTRVEFPVTRMIALLQEPSQATHVQDLDHVPQWERLDCVVGPDGGRARLWVYLSERDGASFQSFGCGYTPPPPPNT